ncbi:MAG: phosphomannose isomerase type II C-terminal cupin domain, partial [Rhabdochlamydiaceae bacterium]
TIIAQIGTKKQRGKPGDLFIVPKRKKHRIMGITEAIILEVAFGKVLETDIVRYEDDYGRV